MKFFKKALVTGGTGGIGKHLVNSLINNGYYVYILSREKKDSEIIEIFPDNFKYIKHIAVNFESILETQNVIKYVNENISNIDVFIFNAGVSKDTISSGLTEEGYNKLFQVNTIAPLLMTIGFIEKFPESRYIFISSISSILFPHDILEIDFNKYFKSKSSNGIEYGLSKYCLNLFSKYISDNYGIDTISIDPGFIPSEGMNKSTNKYILELKCLYFKTNSIKDTVNFIINNSILVNTKLKGNYLEFNYNKIEKYSEYNKISLIKSLKEICLSENISYFINLNEEDKIIFDIINKNNKYIQQPLSLYPFIVNLICMYYIITKKLKIDALVYIVITAKLVNISKKIIKNDRPERSINSDYLLIYNIKDESSGFPSYHAYVSFLFSSIIYGEQKIKGIYKIIFLILALIVSYSRVYYNNHTIIQIVVGSLLGILSGVFYNKKIKNLKNIDIIIKIIILVIIVFSILVIIGLYKVKLYNDKCLKDKIPVEFEDISYKYEIQQKFVNKIIKNSDYYNYWFGLLKSLLYVNSNKKITWEIIDNELHNHNIPSDVLSEIDILVGIFSGGGFIVKRFGDILEKDITYIESKVWTDQGIDNFTKKILTSKLDNGNVNDDMTDINKIKGKNILLVDDTCYTGTTLTTIKKYLLSIGALSVKTYCIYSSITGNEDIINYYSSKINKIPLYWPWGYEIN